MNFNSHYQDFGRPMAFDSLDCKLTTTSFISHVPDYNQSYHPGTDIEATDVLCGRGKTSFNHVGNRRFRDLIAASTEKYNNAKSRLEKSLVVHQIVEQVRKVKGRFLKQDRFSGRWYELDERQAKEKVGHAIRDATSSLDPNKQKNKTLSKSVSRSNNKNLMMPTPVKSTSAVVVVKKTPRNKKVLPPRTDSVSSEASAATVMSDNTSDPWDDMEPLHVDSMEAKNSLAALQKDEFFLLQMKAVFRFEVV